MSFVFISYNQLDGDIAALLMMQLEKVGFDTWLDKQRLRGGMDWSVEIDRGISEAFALVVIMSPDAKASEYVTYEWSFAIGAAVPVIPVLVRKTELHPRLARLQYLDFTNNARPWGDLIKELRDIRDARGEVYRVPRDTPAFIKRATEELESPNIIARKSAVDTLVDAAHPVAWDVLVNALRHPLYDVRLRAAIAVGSRGDMSAINILVDEILNDAQDRVTSGVWQALAALGRPAVPKLLESLKSGNSFYVNFVARPALAEILDTSDVPFLLSWLQGQDVELRRDAVFLLGSIGDEAATPHLLDLWAKSTDGQELSEVAKALIALKGERALPVFLEHLRNGVQSTRHAAVQALQFVPGKEADDALIQIVQKVDLFPPDLRAVALNALRHRMNENARDFLIRWEREHPQGGSFPTDKN